MELEQESPLLAEKKHEYHSLPLPWKQQSKRRHRLLIWALSSVAILSLSLNVFQAIVSTLSGNRGCPSESKLSPYANLDEPAELVGWSQDSVYTSANASLADAAWDAINHDSGIVAVDKSWALQKGLPLGSTFPWDSRKAIYFVNAYHGLHCLKNIYRAFMEYREDMPQSLEHHHITHCLDQLRADVLCTADDTLRVTTPDMRPVTAEGQGRKCRNWDTLQRWTLDHPGCYRYGDPNVEDEKESQIPRMRYCPAGSVELDAVRAYFGRGSNWYPAEEPVWSWFD